VDTSLLRFFAPEQVQRQATKSGHILGRIADADAAVIFTKDHIQRPMTGILNPPMRPNRARKLRSVDRQTATDMS
jgi:hypothetical protein